MAWEKGTNPAFASWAYGYNLRGQRTSSTELTGREAAYGYDAASRLTSETITGDPSGNGALTYVLDPVGNRSSRTSTLAALAAQSFSYDANDELTSDAYDLNGNTTSSGGHTYAYDFENRLISNDGGAVTVVYDGDGNRVAKTAGGVTTQYLVDDLNPTGYLQVIDEVSGGTVQVRYTYGNVVVSQARNQIGGIVPSFYGYDAHGNIGFLTDATGTETDTYTYDAWGIPIGRTGTTLNTRLFLGEEFDPDLGFINLRARQYGASVGRFSTLDPWGGDVQSPNSLNKYLYSNADPINLSDPSGRETLVSYGLLSIREMFITTVRAVVYGYIAGCGIAYAVGAFDLVDNTDTIPVIWQWCAKGRKQHKSNEYSRAAQTHPDPCAYLERLYQAARAKGDSVESQKLKLAQKVLGCRQHN